MEPRRGEDPKLVTVPLADLLALYDELAEKLEATDPEKAAQCRANAALMRETMRSPAPPDGCMDVRGVAMPRPGARGRRPRLLFSRRMTISAPRPGRRVGRTRPRERREQRHVARSTSSADPGDGEPHQPFGDAATPTVLARRPKTHGRGARS
jgi:hypothetical protein